MWIKSILRTLLLILIFADLQIDFSIDFFDSPVSGFMTIFCIGMALKSSIEWRTRKNMELARRSLSIFMAVLLGAGLGNLYLQYQFESASRYVEELAGEIATYQSSTGKLPAELKMVDGYDRSGKVAIGIFKKRPLNYFIEDKGKAFVLSFPFRFGLVADFSSETSKWSIDG